MFASLNTRAKSLMRKLSQPIQRLAAKTTKGPSSKPSTVPADTYDGRQALQALDPRSQHLLERAAPQSVEHTTGLPARKAEIERPGEIPPVPSVSIPDFKVKSQTLKTWGDLGLAEARTNARRTMEDFTLVDVSRSYPTVSICDGHGGDTRIAGEAAAVLAKELPKAVDGLPRARRRDPIALRHAIKDAYMGKPESILATELRALLDSSAFPILTVNDRVTSETINGLLDNVRDRAKGRASVNPKSMAKFEESAKKLQALICESNNYDNERPWLLRANLLIFMKELGGPVHQPFSHKFSGTTALTALFINDKRWIALSNLGDGRALWRHPDGRMEQLTFDQTANDEREKMEKRGVAISDRAHFSRVNNNLMVTRAIGDHRADLNGYLVRRPQVTLFEAPATGGHLILGCDGIFNFLDQDAIGRCVEEASTPGAAAEAIVCHAAAASGQGYGVGDNLSVAVLKVEAQA